MYTILHVLNCNKIYLCQNSGKRSRSIRLSASCVINYNTRQSYNIVVRCMCNMYFVRASSTTINRYFHELLLFFHLYEPVNLFKGKRPLEIQIKLSRRSRLPYISIVTTKKILKTVVRSRVDYTKPVYV